VENLNRRDNFGEQGADRRIILSLILGKQSVKVCTPFTCIRISPIVGFCENDNEPLGPTEGRVFLNLASSYQLYKENRVPLVITSQQQKRLFKYRHGRLKHFLL
jgi:hypothetical protein